MEISQFRGKFYFLSNFSPCQIAGYGTDFTADKKLFPAVENAFQFAKSMTPTHELRKEFTALTPREAKIRGRKLELRNDWEHIKLQVMKHLLMQKFSNRELKIKLLETADWPLVEGNTWGDTYWGVCRGRGQNNLGKLLMEVREHFYQEYVRIK